MRPHRPLCLSIAVAACRILESNRDNGGEDEHSANIALLARFPIDFACCWLYMGVYNAPNIEKKLW